LKGAMIKMFLDKQNTLLQNQYKSILGATGAISNLFSDSVSPYLNYRSTENIFCKVFDAENLSRSDCSADAKKGNLGFGIKTFLNVNGKTIQKVAEFNSDSKLFANKLPKEIVIIVSNLRNARIKATMRIHGLDKLIYHCIVREPGKIKVFECNMDEINIKKIKNIIQNKNTITFEDDMNEYTFNISKSTLYKRFITTDVLMQIDVDILVNPYEFLLQLSDSNTTLDFIDILDDKEHIFLPLYSDKGKRHVPEKSGLNQWNAGGRKRDSDEVYIPIPSLINKKYPDFFPGKDIPFELKLPDGNSISAKVCQDGNKALMSNPNKSLGKWILRQVMNLKERKLLTYESLEELGIDSVVLYKESDGIYSINFTSLGSYDDFINNND
jgi:hypothetical protein